MYRAYPTAKIPGLSTGHCIRHLADGYLEGAVTMKEKHTIVNTVRTSQMILAMSQQERTEKINQLDSYLLVDVFECLAMLEGNECVNMDDNSVFIIDNKEILKELKAEIKERLNQASPSK